jgi:hypothetical protein
MIPERTGKCWGCGNYVFHDPKCPASIPNAARYVVPIVNPVPPRTLLGLPCWIGDEDHPITTGTQFGITRSAGSLK